MSFLKYLLILIFLSVFGYSCVWVTQCFSFRGNHTWHRWGQTWDIWVLMQSVSPASRFLTILVSLFNLHQVLSHKSNSLVIHLKAMLVHPDPTLDLFSSAVWRSGEVFTTTVTRTFLKVLSDAFQLLPVTLSQSQNSDQPPEGSCRLFS